MDKKSKQEKRRLYNKQWISAKRRRMKMENTEKQETEEDSEDITSRSHHEMQTHSEDWQYSSTHRTDTEDHQNVDLQQDDNNYSSDNPVLRIYDSSTDSESECENITERLLDNLRQWVNEFEIKGNAVDRLLKILRDNGHPDIPVSARTLRNTPRIVELLKVSSMDYYHFGLEKMINHTLKKYAKEVLQNIQVLFLSLNIDGLPLFKSTNTSAWPLLGVITNLTPIKPFPITLTVGKTKPSNLDFLKEMIRELNNMLANGLNFSGIHFEIKLKCIICDAPAKAFVKCVKQFSGYYGFDKCNQRGHYVGRMTYPETTNLVLRTDSSFRNRVQEEHHKETNTPFLDVPVDMIKDFPVDYMHQVCLGVMRKLLTTWMRGSRRNTRLSIGQINLISTKLLALKQFIPCEFARKPRSLEEVDRWKATEFRQFLLYTGQFALKGILPDNLYEHFMCLCVAINILVNETLAFRHGRYADSLLSYFVSKSHELYGQEFCVYNVHSLLHLKQETDRYGALDNCAAWPFENFMQQLKRKVRGGNNPAAQLVKRIQESTEYDVNPEFLKTKRIKWKNPNNMYRTERDKYCEVIRPVNSDEQAFLCRVYHTPELSFDQPCNSDLIGHVKFATLNYAIKTIDANKLITRCVRFTSQTDNKLVFVPLQHNLN